MLAGDTAEHRIKDRTPKRSLLVTGMRMNMACVHEDVVGIHAQMLVCILSYSSGTTGRAAKECQAGVQTGCIGQDAMECIYNRPRPARVREAAAML